MEIILSLLKTGDRGLPGGPGLKTLCAPSKMGPSFDPWSGTRSRMLQLRVHIPPQTIPHAATKKDTAKTKTLDTTKLKKPGQEVGRALASNGEKTGMLLNQQCTGHPHNKG